jgi:hypothetical protein
MRVQDGGGAGGSVKLPVVAGEGLDGLLPLQRVRIE